MNLNKQEKNVVKQGSIFLASLMAFCSGGIAMMFDCSAIIVIIITTAITLLTWLIAYKALTWVIRSSV